MKLYIVRHGESIGNVKKIVQGPKTPLSQIGKSQAKILAHRFKKIKVDALLTSTYKRASQTAQEIAKVTNLQVTQKDIFREFDWPTELRGLPMDSKRVKTVQNTLKAHNGDPDWRYKGTENFFDLKDRVDQAVDFILGLNKDRVVLVSHGFFIVTLISRLIFEPITKNLGIFEPIVRSIEYHNTGITMLKHEKDKWILATLNDHAHLG